AATGVGRRHGGRDRATAALDRHADQRVLGGADWRHAQHHACLLRRLVVRHGRFAFAAGGGPHFEGHLLVRRVHRQRVVVVLAQARVVEHARRLRFTRFAALDRVVIAFAGEGLDALVPRRLRGGWQGGLDGRPGLAMYG